jgi:hypothetical protein
VGAGCPSSDEITLPVPGSEIHGYKSSNAENRTRFSGNRESDTVAANDY